METESNGSFLPSFFNLAGLKTQIARALALQDRTVASPTYGCFDRAYWYYRTLVGFPGATWQQLSFPLAWIVLGCPQCGLAVEQSRSLIQAAKAGLLYWTKVQHADGSFDEFYRNERSYCPTAFTLGGMMEAALLLAENLDQRERDSVAVAGRRAGTWLADRFNSVVANQNLAAVWGMFALAKLTDDHRFHNCALRKLERTLQQQSCEGWFAEYEGMDLGYSTLALALLALASRYDQSQMILSAAERLSDFLWSISVGGPLPGKLGSRGTCHVFPYGAFFFADRFASAASLSTLWLAGFKARILSLPSEIDDRYFAYFYLPQFVLAAVEAATPKQLAPAAASPASRICLPESGLIILRCVDTSFFISRHLGGAVARIEGRLPPQYLLGYTLLCRDGTVATTSYWSPTTSEADEESRGNRVPVSTPFARQRLDQPLAKFQLPFALFTHALASSWISDKAQRWIKAKFVRPRRLIDARLDRSIMWDDVTVSIEDRIMLGSIGEISLLLSDEVAAHSASSRLYAGDQPVRLEPLSSGLRVTQDQRGVILRYRIGLCSKGTIELVSWEMIPGPRRQRRSHDSADLTSGSTGSIRVGELGDRP